MRKQKACTAMKPELRWLVPAVALTGLALLLRRAFCLAGLALLAAALLALHLIDRRNASEPLSAFSGA